MSNVNPEESKEIVQRAIESGLVKLPPASMEVAAPKQIALTPTDIQVTAENADEMVHCQSAIIEWCKAKCGEVRSQWQELKEAYEHAVQRKWKSDTLKRHSAMAEKRLSFYERMLAALEHGYQIVPSFPITAFAIRTDKNKPLKMFTTSWGARHTQEPPGLPAGEGDYKNPFPIVFERTLEPQTATKPERKAYWAEAWKDLEFPLSMSKPKIMTAATRAMSLKIFDDIGILPGFAANEGTRPPRGDPMIIARLKDPRPTGYSDTRYISFIIAWHLDTKTL